MQTSCLYEGHVRHRRFVPRRHEFRKRLFLLYLDLDELPRLFQNRWFWSADRPNLAWFRRVDHLGAADVSLNDAVRDLVENRQGVRPRGPIRLLTHLRYAGFGMNPISLYYCFGEREDLEFVVAEINNTPWNERHCYVLDARAANENSIHALQPKVFHVSPFLGMNYDYRFMLTKPGQSLTVHIENHRQDGDGSSLDFDATLTLCRRPMTTRSLASVLVRYPLMTAQVYAAIYWQAFRLWLKGTRYFPHPQAISSCSDPFVNTVAQASLSSAEVNRLDHSQVLQSCDQ